MSSSLRSEPPGAGSLGRREWMLAALAAFGGVCLARSASAQSAYVPVNVQAGLIAKVAGFDRNFRARAGARAVVIIATMQDDAESRRAALEMNAELGLLPKIGDLPHQAELVNFVNAAALAEIVRAKRAAIVYFGPGFTKHMAAIRAAFSSISVLTVGALASYVTDGVVLGFDLVSGRPKLVIHLPQARKQQIAFPASVLNLMKVQS